MDYERAILINFATQNKKPPKRCQNQQLNNFYTNGYINSSAVRQKDMTCCTTATKYLLPCPAEKTR